MDDEIQVLDDDDVIEIEDEEEEKEPEEPEETESEKTKPEKTEPENEEEEDKGQKDETVEKMVELESELQKARKEINRLGYALRKQEKKEPEPETAFTDAQLVKIIDENADDPAVLLQVVKQAIKQEVSGVKDEAIDAAEIKRVKGELKNYLETNWPDIKDETSETYKNLVEAKQWMKLDDHPYGDFLATAAVVMQQLPDMIEKAKEEAKAEALKTKTEKTRKEKIKGNKAPKSGKPTVTEGELPPNFNETAQSLGLTKRQMALYAKMISGAKKGKSLRAEV